jgi:hypothetical protein
MPWAGPRVYLSPAWRSVVGSSRTTVAVAPERLPNPPQLDQERQREQQPDGSDDHENDTDCAEIDARSRRRDRPLDPKSRDEFRPPCLATCKARVDAREARLLNGHSRTRTKWMPHTRCS